MCAVEMPRVWQPLWTPGWAQKMLTVLMFTNSFKPYSESSLPIPDFFIPPKGTRGSDFTRLLTKTIPLSIL